MRRLATFILLLVFLFNIIGYYGVYMGLRSHANEELIQKLDDGDYSKSETFTIAIPFNLPYQSDWSSFRRVDGDFEYEGKFFNIVEQKFERDTLFVVCIPDHRETTLFESLTNFVHATTNSPVSKNTGKLIDVSKDFIPTVSELATISSGWVRDEDFTSMSFDIVTHIVNTSSPPPRA